MLEAATGPIGFISSDTSKVKSLEANNRMQKETVNS
jgi:hypothetical protein